MAAGLTQVATKGPHEFWFNDDPRFSLFDKAYIQFEKFGIDTIRLTEGASNVNFGNTMSLKFPKIGDFAIGASIEWSLPALTPTATGAVGTQEVSWIPKIGIFGIKKLQFEASGTYFEEYTPEFIDIYSQYKYTGSKLCGYYEMIGQAVPSSWFADGKVINFCDGPQVPSQSKPAYNILTPLSISYFEQFDHSFPMINAMFTELKFNIEWRAAADCYILKDGTMTEPSLGDAKIYLDVTYLTQAGRARVMKFQPRIPYRYVQTGSEQIQEANKQIKLSLNRPIYEIIFTTREKTAAAAKQWDFYDRYTNNPEKIPMEQITSAKLITDSETRFDGRGRKFHNRYTPFKHHTGIPKSKNIHTICFATDPENWRPTGFYNFSQVSDIKLDIVTTDISSGNPADFFYFGLCYMIMKTRKGFAGPAYVN